MIEIKWYREFIEKRWWWEHWYGDMKQYEIFYIDDWIKYIAKLDNDYWDCYSWYISATRGNIEIENVDEFWTIHFIPIWKIEVNNINDFVDVDEDWWDHYYPSWYAKIRDKYINMFKKTSRFKENRQVYLFMWPSWIGKSYIAHNTNLDVYETDRSNFLPSIINASIIVIWNKYEFKIDDIKDMCGDDVDFVYVNFNS